MNWTVDAELDGFNPAALLQSWQEDRGTGLESKLPVCLNRGINNRRSSNRCSPRCPGPAGPLGGRGGKAPRGCSKGQRPFEKPSLQRRKSLQLRQGAGPLRKASPQTKSRFNFGEMISQLCFHSMPFLCIGTRKLTHDVQNRSKKIFTPIFYASDTNCEPLSARQRFQRVRGKRTMDKMAARGRMHKKSCRMIQNRLHAPAFLLCDARRAEKSPPAARFFCAWC